MNIKYEARMKKLLNLRMNDVHESLTQHKEYTLIKQKLNSINASLIESFSEDQRKKYKECMNLHRQMLAIVKSEMYFQGCRDAFELLEFLNMFPK